jgi:transcriptional regulator of acetoin/glycerol metabolism
MPIASLDELPDVEPTAASTPAKPVEFSGAVQGVIKAYQLRTEAFEEADRIRKDARRRANEQFAQTVRHAVEERDTNMSELSRALKLSRVTLHQVVREHG